MTSGLNIRETEKPKESGYSAKSFLSKVDLPVPEGPEITIGRPGILRILYRVEYFSLVKKSKEKSKSAIVARDI